MNITIVMGAAGAGKSTFTQLAKVCDFNTISISTNLHMVVNFLCKTKNHENVHVLFNDYLINKLKYDFSDEEAYIISRDSIEYIRTHKPIMHNGSRRNYLQHIGTEIMRGIKPDCHIDSVVNYMVENDNNTPWVVESVRFVNEIEKLRSIADRFTPLVIRRIDSEPLTADTCNHVSEKEWLSWVKENNLKTCSIQTIENNGSKLKFISDSVSFLRFISPETSM